jgi:hypothetical protein
MMNTQSTPTHLQCDSSSESVHESVNKPSPPLTEVVPKEEEEFALPKPDPDNITVLTHKLPDKPILPWNRYDSPWREGEGEEETKEPKAEATAARAPIPNEEGCSCPLPQPEDAIAAQLQTSTEPENEEPEVDEVE